jgi:phosphoglycerate dehydrogenase-like enzyme
MQTVRYATSNVEQSGACRVRVVFIAQVGNEEPWRTHFVERFAAVLGGRHELAHYDHGRPPAGQFDGTTAVVDQGGHATEEMIDTGAAAGVRLWQVITTGLDHVRVRHMQGHGLDVANTPGIYSATALAEHALMLMLMLAKRMDASRAELSGGRLYHPMGEELHGKTLGIVGLGASGAALGRLAVALGMEVAAVDVTDPPADAPPLAWFGGQERLRELMAWSDVVSLHVPLNAGTTGLIDAASLEAMRPGALLINVARGALVDEGALLAALDNGLGGAGLDVFSHEPPAPDDPLMHHPKVIATPHTAGITEGTSRRRNAAAVENVRRLDAGEPLLHVLPPF